jgi:hypothetical protein
MLALFAVLVPLNSGQSMAGQWQTVAKQGFEGMVFPAGNWITYDCSHTTTQGIWAKAPGAGFNSANAAHPRAGVSPYSYNTCTWMRYGPFSLAGATNARMIFKYRLDTEIGYDFFSWAYSCNGVAAWTARTLSGNSPSAWTTANLSLKPCVGETQVYVQFTFTSDQSVNYSGVWVDNVHIQKRN